jgi:hypothetical protein
MGRAGRLPDVAGSRGIGTQSSMRTRRPSADPTRTTRRKASKMTAGDLGGDPSADVTAESAGGTAVEAAPDLPPDVVAAVAVPADPAVTPPVPPVVVAAMAVRTRLLGLQLPGALPFQGEVRHLLGEPGRRGAAGPERPTDPGRAHPPAQRHSTLRTDALRRPGRFGAGAPALSGGRPPQGEGTSQG